MPASRRTALERERRRLEAAVQARTRRSPGSRVQEAEEFDLDVLFDELGGSSLIELVEVDGVLHVITVADRRVRLHTVGSVPEDEIQDESLPAAPPRAESSPVRRRAVADLPGQPRWSPRCSAPLPPELGDGPVVVIPPGRLQAVPWTLMPSLRDRAVTVAPSALTWVRARHKRPPAHRRVALVVGPGLATGGAEVAQLRSGYPEAVMLGHGSATAEQVLGALDGAWLAHIAAHGTFRADNPMFSSHPARRWAADRARLRAPGPRAVPAGPVQLRLRGGRAGGRRRAAGPGQQPGPAGRGRDRGQRRARQRRAPRCRSCWRCTTPFREARDIGRGAAGRPQSGQRRPAGHATAHSFLALGAWGQGPARLTCARADLLWQASRVTMRQGWESEAQNWAHFARTPGLDRAHEDINLPALLRPASPAGSGRWTWPAGRGGWAGCWQRWATGWSGIDASPTMVRLAATHEDRQPVAARGRHRAALPRRGVRPGGGLHVPARHRRDAAGRGGDRSGPRAAGPAVRRHPASGQQVPGRSRAVTRRRPS